MNNQFKNFVKRYILYIAWVQSLIAMLGSLFFSEIMKLPPCILCWYQRIFMYPLALLVAIGILRKDKGIYHYILPLSITGLFISVYHNLLYYNILPESIQPCTVGVSCTARQIEWLGFITIPLLSLTAFASISLCMILFRKVTTK